MNPNQNKFFRYLQKAKQKKQKGKYAQALELFNKAKTLYRQEYEPFNKFNLVQEIAEMNRRIGKFKQSKSFYKQAKIIFKNQLRHGNNNKLDLLSVEYQLLCNEALLYTDQAQTIGSYEDWSNFKQYINFAVKNLILAHQITLKVLIGDKLEREEEEWWSEQYIASIINLINPLQLEGDKYEDEKFSEIIIELTEKINQFYEMSAHKKILRDNLSKSYYYRAINLMKLKKYTEAEKYFQLDYKHCQKYHKVDDLQKTRKGYISFLIQLQRLDEVKKYLVSSEEKLNLAGLIKLKNEVNDEIRFLQTNRSSQKIKNLLQKLGENKFYRKILSFANSQLQNYSDSQTLFSLRYYLALACFEDDNFKEGFPHIIEALKLCGRKQKKYFDAFLLRIQYVEFFQKERKKSEVIEMLDELIRIGEQTGDRRYYDEGVKIKREYETKWQRGQRHTYFCLSWQEQEELLKKMKVQIKQTLTKDENSQDGRLFFLSNNQKKRKSKKEETREKYESLVREKNLPFRKKLLDLIDASQDNTIAQIDLAMMFNLTQKQLEVLVEVFHFSKLDFGHHHLSIQLLDRLCHQTYLYSLKYFKINNNVVKVQHLKKFVEKVNNLEQLVLKNICSLANSPPIILPFTHLKVLKLKHSQLTDELIDQLEIEKLQNLKQLDLAGNNIDGTCLQFVDSLTKIEELNLSQNPLNNVKLEGKNKLKRIKLKGIHQIRKISILLLIRQLLNSSIIDLSENKGENIQLILDCLIENCYQREVLNFPNLIQLRLKKCNLTSECLKRVRQMLSMSPRLAEIDLRFCYWEEHWEDFKISVNNKVHLIKYKIINPFAYNYKRKQT